MNIDSIVSDNLKTIWQRHNIIWNEVKNKQTLTKITY